MAENSFNQMAQDKIHCAKHQRILSATPMEYVESFKQ